MLRSLSQLKLYFWNPFFLTLTFLSDVGRSNHTDGLWSRKQSFWSISIPFWFHLTFKFSDVVNVLCFIHSQIQCASYTKCLNWLFLIIPKIDSNVFFFFKYLNILYSLLPTQWFSVIYELPYFCNAISAFINFYLKAKCCNKRMWKNFVCRRDLNLTEQSNP